MNKMAKSSEKVTISIIVTAHSEGILAHKTVLSVFENVANLPTGVTYEIIVGIDNPTPETSDYFKRYEKDDCFKLLEVNFGDPSQNRNNAISYATGEYVLLFDGDDLLSANFLKTAFSKASATKSPALIHPQAHLQFGVDEENCKLWLCEDSFSLEEDALIMTYWNRWPNVQFGKREIFLEHPFVPAKNGYGYEDFHFNSETRAADIKQLVAPETMLFYRRKAGSIQSQHIAQNTVVAKTSLLDVEFIKNLPVSAGTTAGIKPSFAKRAVGGAYRAAMSTAKKVEPIRRLTASTVRNIMYKKRIKTTPRWVIEQWKAINPIENQLYPTKGEVAKLEFHPLSFNQHWTSFGEIYKHLVDSVTRESDYLFLPPELGVGGTEKLMFNYARAIAEAHPEWQITIIGKRPDTTAFEIPDSVDFVDFDGITRGLGEYEKNILWDRFFIQLGAKRLHIVNNKRWLTWARRHLTLLKNNDYKLYISLFMREFTHEKDRVLTLSDPEIREVWPAVTKVFTDNQKVVDQALENNAFESEKFAVHYQPETSKLIAPKKIDPSKPLRILWASRIAHQKRPDILKKVANRLGGKVVIDAYGFIEKKQFPKSYFSDSHVNYKGAFSGISSIPTEDYDLYLYTSETDGVPNILLEIAAKGLPIISSNVGGISEFIDNDSGVLVDNTINGFVLALRKISSNPEKSLRFAENAQKKLMSQHSWGGFLEKVQKDIK